MMIGRGKRDGDMRVMNGHRKRHKRGNTKETRKESDKERLYKVYERLLGTGRCDKRMYAP